MVGDALVTPSSAAGILDPTTHAGPFPGCTVRLFPKVTHRALVNHPEIRRHRPVVDVICSAARRRPGALLG